jgi:hypothetical protein
MQTLKVNSCLGWWNFTFNIDARMPTSFVPAPFHRRSVGAPYTATACPSLSVWSSSSFSTRIVVQMSRVGATARARRAEAVAGAAARSLDVYDAGSAEARSAPPHVARVAGICTGSGDRGPEKREDGADGDGRYAGTGGMRGWESERGRDRPSDM